MSIHREVDSSESSDPDGRRSRLILQAPMDEAASLFSAVSACGMRSSPMGLLGTSLETPAVPTIEQQEVGKNLTHVGQRAHVGL